MSTDKELDSLSIGVQSTGCLETNEGIKKNLKIRCGISQFPPVRETCGSKIFNIEKLGGKWKEFAERLEPKHWAY